MKTTITTDDKQEALIMLRATESLLLISDINGHIRSKIKNGEITEETEKELEEIRSMILETNLLDIWV